MKTDELIEMLSTNVAVERRDPGGFLRVLLLVVAACILFGFASFWEFIHQRRQLDAVLVLLSKLLEDQKGQSLRFPLIFRS